MGYTSQVAFVVRGPQATMVSIITTYRLTYPNTVEAKNALGHCTYSSDDGELTIRFSDDDIKWYSCYEDVKALMALFEAFEEFADDNDIIGSFMRIGEDDTDIETRRYGDDPYALMYLNRTIETNCREGGSLAAVLGEATCSS